jgi:nickel-dependent lactate racemase
VNGQTAWALLTKTERFRVHIVSKLEEDDVQRMRMTPARSIEEALSATENAKGYIMPRGAALLPVAAPVP